MYRFIHFSNTPIDVGQIRRYVTRALDYNFKRANMTQLKIELYDADLVGSTVTATSIKY